MTSLRLLPLALSLPITYAKTFLVDYYFVGTVGFTRGTAACTDDGSICAYHNSSSGSTASCTNYAHCRVFPGGVLQVVFNNCHASCPDETISNGTTQYGTASAWCPWDNPYSATCSLAVGSGLDTGDLDINDFFDFDANAVMEKCGDNRAAELVTGLVEPGCPPDGKTLSTDCAAAIKGMPDCDDDCDLALDGCSGESGVESDGEDKPCFGRETTTACRLSSAASSASAFEQCFGSAIPSTAERVLLAELRAGDYVLSEAGVATRVVVNQHVSSTSGSAMLTIRHAAGSLELTPDHVLLVDGAFAAAREVKPGSMLGEYEVKAVTRGVAGVINPITVAGTILAAGKEGKPVVASTYPEWVAAYMLSSAVPLPLSLGSALSRVFPVNAQAFYDTVVEPLFPPAAAGSYRPYLESVPSALVPTAFLVGDFVVSTTFLSFLLGPILTIGSAAIAAASAVGRK